MRLYLRLICSFTWVIIVAFTCHGQSYYFKRFQVDEGLSHNSVTTILQDSKGLMWIGTRGGLNRFDGYTFKTIKDPSNQLGYIGNNQITSITEDRQGMLWIGTGKGLFRYDPVKELLTPLDIVPKFYIRGLVIDAQNNLWLLSGYELFRYDPVRKKLEDMKLLGFCIAIDKEMKIWLGTGDGSIKIFSTQNRSLKTLKIITDGVSEQQKSISKILPLENGKVLIGCFKLGLKSLDMHTGQVQTIPLSKSAKDEIFVRDITAASDHEFWIATETGIYIYNFLNNTSRNIRKSAGDPYSIADNAVYTICKDHQNGMWIGTFFGGLNYYSLDNARFEKFYPKLGVNSISGNAVREICSDYKGTIWIGTEDAGLNKLNPKTGKFTNYTVTGSSKDLSYHNIHGLIAVKNQLFIGPFFNGMEIMDLNTEKITDRFKYIGNRNDNKSDFILSMCLTRDSTLLVGTAYNASGLFKYDIKKKTFDRIKQIPYNSYVFDIYEDDKGNIWTGSVSQGVFYYNPKTGKTNNIHFGNTNKANFFGEFAVRYILQDSNHLMWFATEGGGLIKLDANLKTFKRYTVKNGLLSNVIFSIQEDDAKHLWITTTRGLACLDLKTEKIITYTKANGLITDQFNYSSAYKDGKGKMYFGSVKGMIAFNPADFFKRETNPPTYITGFQINNKDIAPDEKAGPLSRSVLFTDTIVLAHDQSSFSIEFAALNYSSPNVTRYKYRMKGLDKEWTYLNSNRKAYFTDLSAGDYTFTVQAESNTGSWTGKERRLFIRILPPFWKSSTAICFYVLVCGLSLYYAVRSYHANNERRNTNKLRLFEHEKEKEIYQAKIEFFTNIAHEIQTPLTLIVGPVEWLIKKTEDQPGIKKNLLMVEKNAKRLSALTAQLLDFRKTEMHQFGLNFVSTDITLLLKEQVAIFRKEVEKANIQLVLNTPQAHLNAFVDREALIKIFSNLISNAIKYAATKATVCLYLAADASDENFSVWFENDGDLIPDEYREKIFEPFYRLKGTNKPGTGIGLSLAKSLAELHNGRLQLLENSPQITVFELSLPIHQQFEFNLSTWKKMKQV
ncbi:histidine kinase [Mucilaginibacter sp. Bleaf8]|uniref:ligand-binding sensor domain-containing protein n=1 Tax=Mucilaginibacter sp. Bleaf8 TaxID=2834430 RepID=UPI001BCEE014|nr:sensor histidine kinase [Mucilaginibacter sp. Bleaf8]MBS7564709.1 histidine kinase [Mucilaginibacter sp. Bleaf8]